MIRLSRIGKKKKPYYRVVVIEKTRPRNGRVVELVGTYDPLKKPAELKLDADRIKHWLGVGAQPSDTVRSFIKLQKTAKDGCRSTPACDPGLALIELGSEVSFAAAHLIAAQVRLFHKGLRTGRVVFALTRLRAGALRIL